MSEQSFQRSLLKSVNNKLLFQKEDENAFTVNDKKVDNIENLKIVMSIRKMFKEDASGKFI